MRRVIRIKFISRAYVRENTSTIFVFGDNMARKGYGGQAGAMRGEPNTIGVPTKWRPSSDDGAYFTDGDFYNAEVVCAINDAFRRMRETLDTNYDVVIPADGLGTGLSELPTRAPRIHAWIEGLIRNLEDDPP